MEAANRDLGPHSLECGRYVYDWQFIHIDCAGWNEGEVSVEEYKLCSDSYELSELRSSA